MNHPNKDNNKRLTELDLLGRIIRSLAFCVLGETSTSGAGMGESPGPYPLLKQLPAVKPASKKAAQKIAAQNVPKIDVAREEEGEIENEYDSEDQERTFAVQQVKKKERLF
jgi:hypothetical protein